LNAGHEDAYGFWGAGSLGLDDWLQLSLGFQHRHSFVAGTSTEAVALRIRAGGESVRATAEGAYALVHPDDPLSRRAGTRRPRRPARAGATWLTAAFGGDFAGNDSPSSVFVLSNSKIAFVDTPNRR
jgi:hypothetical protein